MVCYKITISFRNIISDRTFSVKNPAAPNAFGTRHLISPLPRGEGMKGRVSKIIITKHPHPNPPPSMGRELFGNPDAELRRIL
jgi:hypothetical protein